MSEENTAVAEAEDTTAVVATEVKVDALQDTFQSWVDDGLEEDAIIVKMHEDHGLSYPAAVTRYRKLKSAAGMTSPRGHKSEEVQQFMKDGVENGQTRAEIIAAMVEKFGYTAKSAASTFSVQGKKIGIVAEGNGASSRVPMADVVSFLRANQGLAKAELVAKMAEALGYSESTCGAFYTYVPMAIEWSRQEAEA